MANPKSTVSIAGHPIHPMLVPFPIALFVATFVCDVIYWQNGIDSMVDRRNLAAWRRACRSRHRSSHRAD